MIQKVRVTTNKPGVIKVYRLEGISLKQAEVLAEKLLAEKINQTYTINQPILKNTIEIAYKAGVMNPEVVSIMKAASDLGINLIACDSSYEYTQKNPEFNPLIEHVVTEEPKTLQIKGQAGKVNIIPVRNQSDEQLMELSKDKLFLNLDEMKTIQKYYQKKKKDPTDLELETIAQTWSEHSGHKTFKSQISVDGVGKPPFIERLKNEALKHKDNIVSAFSDNSGVMDFYEGFGICGKVETHNSPSAIEPYGGAMTGSGGVFRDIAATGKGAKNIASTDIFCFADLDLPTRDIPRGCLSPKYLLTRVVMGVRDYGNRIGIPTNNGSVHFHKDFRARPTVIVGAYGIIPKKYAKKGNPKIGDLIINVGGRTGRDGIHGATFSSGAMTDKTIEVNSSAVQIGNAIEEKRMFDALLEARDLNLITLVQDCGGGGFSSAIGEIGEKLGVSVDIKKAPLKYQGLSPWEIWLSESQERMIVVLPREDLKKFENICQKYNVECTVLGKFDGSKRLKVYYGEEKVGDLEMQFLHHGLPKRVLVAKKSSSVILNEVKNLSRMRDSNKLKDPSLVPQDDIAKFPNSKLEWIQVLKKVLCHGNVCSKEPIVRMYDHSVQGTNDLQPFSGQLLDGPNDSPILRPFLNKNYGVVISHGLNPILNNIDPYWGSIWAGVEALSNFVAVGGDYKNASLINNYIWPTPDESTLWSLDKSVDAVVDLMKTFKIPVISGKDSLSSTYQGSDGTVIKIPPVLCMSVFGKIPDARKTVTADFKKTGSTVLLVGKTDHNLGGSVYYQAVYPKLVETTDMPKADLKILPKIFSAIYKAISKGKLLSVHDISEGGVIAGIFEMCVGGNCGVKLSKQIEKLLFNETAGCFLVEVESEAIGRELFASIPVAVLGKTQKEQTISVDKLFNADLIDLKKVWQKPMKEIFA